MRDIDKLEAELKSANLELSDFRLNCAATAKVIEAGEKEILRLSEELKAAREEADKWQKTTDMYANAWRRELGEPLRCKRHEIDMLVVNTRALKDKLTITTGALATYKEALRRAAEEAVLSPDYRTPDNIAYWKDKINKQMQRWLTQSNPQATKTP